MNSWLKDFLSLAVVMVSFYIILFRPEDVIAREFSFGAIGLIIGHYLNTGKKDAVVNRQ